VLLSPLFLFLALFFLSFNLFLSSNPNLSCVANPPPLEGPNVASGHGSAIFVEEVQANYIAQIIKPILIDGTVRSIVVKPEANEAYNDQLQSKLRGTVWNSCISYYNQNTKGAKNVGESESNLSSRRGAHACS
jgi:hypothetical protein